MNMQWREFIFSEQRKHKLLRHLVFWAAWWTYFTVCYYVFQQPLPRSTLKPYYLTPGAALPVKTFLMVLMYALACYPLIYFILPKIINGKLLKGTAFFILLCSLLFIASYLLYWKLFSFIDPLARSL